MRVYLRACTLLGVIALVATPAAAASREAVVRVATGCVLGVESDGVVAFKGIPYAAPPVGPLRWRAPQPAHAWTDTLRATDYGASCPQAETPRHVDPASRGATTNEDCLTLNLWARSGARRDPVIVWIHGGGNDNGTSAQTYYDGTAFARDSVVFVSLNYRLGMFGFFAHGLITTAQTAGERANFGLLDQLAALRWVRSNVAAFGGDTSNVTVMGESAGGEDIVTLLAAPAARGLLQKAIVESEGGGWGRLASLADAEVEGAAAITAAGPAATLDAMRALPVEALVKAGAHHDAGPVVDGTLLPESPLRALATGRAIHVPLLIGTNDGEGSLLTDPGSPDAMFPRLDAATRAKLRAAYGDAAHDDAAFARLLFRDAFFAAPTRFVARQMSRDAAVYVYRFDYVASILRRRRANAYHGSEIPFVFETLDPMYALAADRDVARDMHECWVTFARTGTPSARRVPPWPAFAANDERMMVFGETPAMAPADSAGVLGVIERALVPGAK